MAKIHRRAFKMLDDDYERLKAEKLRRNADDKATGLHPDSIHDVLHDLVQQLPKSTSRKKPKPEKTSKAQKSRKKQPSQKGQKPPKAIQQPAAVSVGAA